MTGIEIAVAAAAAVILLGGLGVLAFYAVKLRRAAAEAGVQARAAAEAVTQLQRRLKEQEAAGLAPGQAGAPGGGATGPPPQWGGGTATPPAYRDQRGWPNL